MITDEMRDELSDWLAGHGALATDESKESLLRRILAMSSAQPSVDVERDISGETVCGFRVAAYRETHPEHGDKFGHIYSEHWSTPNNRDPRIKIERLFTEYQLRAALALPGQGERPDVETAQPTTQEVTEMTRCYAGCRGECRCHPQNLGDLMADYEGEVATIDRWNPGNEDPFWMLEAEDGEWLKNERTLSGTRDPAKAMRFPTERECFNHPARMSAGSKWWSSKPTEHLWMGNAALTQGGEHDPS